MPQFPIYELSSDILETAENRYDVLPLRVQPLSDCDRFCLNQTINLARQRQKRFGFSVVLEQDLRCCRNWAVQNRKE